MSKIIIISISLLIILIFGNWIILPYYRDLKIIKAKVSEKEAEFASKEEYFGQIETLAQQLEQYSEELAKVEFAFLPDFELADFFQFLQKACSENGLIFKDIKGFETKQPAKSAKIKVNTVNFEVSGSFESLINFLKTLEKSARMIEVIHLSLETPPTEAEAQKEVFTYKFKVEIHSY